MLDDYSGHIYFKMHDLVHDLAQSIMEKECMVLGNANMTDLSTSTHHVGLGFDRDVLLLNKRAFEKVKSLRTFYELKNDYKQEVSAASCFPTHRCLRVLRTSSSNLSPLKNLIHLRYMELFKLEIKTLPDSIYSLRKFEILKLKYLENLDCLPKHLSSLQDLRHLVIEGCDSFSCMFPNIGKLSCLRTLSKYIVSSEIGHSLAELHDLKLTGNLCIEGRENVGSLSEAQEANLMGKKDLYKLQLGWKRNHPKPCAELVLNALQPHLYLKNLVIGGYDGLQFPAWIGMLTNLVSLELSRCVKCLWLPSLGKLPYLRSISISKMNDVQYMDDEESYDGVEVKAYPSLEKLYLSWCPKLERLLKVERRENFPCLSSLEIIDCPKLEVQCCIPSLKRLYVSNYTNELLSSLSDFNGLTSLFLSGGEVDLTSFPVGTLTCLQTLEICGSAVLKELPNELFKNLNTLETLAIWWCSKLESLPEQGWEGLRSLQNLEISGCCELKSLPDGVRHLTSLQLLIIQDCPALAMRCKVGTGEDWDKIAHVPKVQIDERKCGRICTPICSVLNQKSSKQLKMNVC